MWPLLRNCVGGNNARIVVGSGIRSISNRLLYTLGQTVTSRQHNTHFAMIIYTEGPLYKVN